MKYVSTRDNSKEYNFEQVFIKGLADDGGLYVPTSLKKYSPQELQKLKKLSYNEFCLLYTSPSPRDGLLSRMPSSA